MRNLLAEHVSCQLQYNIASASPEDYVSAPEDSVWLREIVLVLLVEGLRKFSTKGCVEK